MSAPARCFFIALVALGTVAGCNGDPEPKDPIDEVPVIEVPPEEPVDGEDFFVRRYADYLDPEVRDEYERTPPEDRFARYGPLLLDLQAREELLASVRPELQPSDGDLREYYDQESYDACARLVARWRARRPGDGR